VRRIQFPRPGDYWVPTDTKLKRLVADLSLDKAMLQDVLAKKL
jgi:hypothetical protein